MLDHHLGTPERPAVEGCGRFGEPVVQELLDGDSQDGATGGHVGQQTAALLL